MFSAVRGGSSKKVAENATEGIAEKGEDIHGFVQAGLQHRGGGRLRLAAGAGAVAAPDLAVDDWRLQGLLGAVIGGRAPP